jgi:hypothetical protein
MKLLVNFAKADPTGRNVSMRFSRSWSVRNSKEQVIESGTSGVDWEVVLATKCWLSVPNGTELTAKEKKRR